MTGKILIRRDTAANWASVNPTLSQGEPALETDTGKRKLGDGVTPWSSLAYDLDLATATATYLPLAARAGVPFGTGQLALNPSGQTVAAITAFTTGTNYDPTKWTVLGASQDDANGVAFVMGLIGL